MWRSGDGRGEDEYPPDRPLLVQALVADRLRELRAQAQALLTQTQRWRESSHAAIDVRIHQRA
jgi:hypothetical protein